MSGVVGELAARYHLHRSGRAWRGDCPSCGYAGAFSLRVGRHGRPLLWCASCNDREALAGMLGRQLMRPDPQAERDRQADRAKKQEAAAKLWRGSEPLLGTLAVAYLEARGLGHLVACPDLRFRADCWHPEGGRLPALVALVRDAGGEPMGVHRTYLRADGTAKADVEPNRAGLGPTWGGAVRLGPLAGELVVGEGIESAAAAGVLAELPAWAAVSAGNLAKGLVLPVGVRGVVIAVDRDAPGEQAAREAWGRWRAEGRYVTCLIPDRPGTDAADVLLAQQVGPSHG